ncbi:MAG TPA: ATP synthase F1 subunit gamma [Firmicutes bacterium]|mgnify:CR=1 FL=1|nr:ATP synthase F1 subunit gamma [Bacillota bacterium]
MATLREVRKRIRSAQNIQQITKAMKMVAAAKLRKAQDRIIAARPYSDKIIEVINELIARTDGEHYPLLKKNLNTEKEAVIVVSADKGLCGSFNTNISKEIMYMLKENTNMYLYYIGKKSMDLLRRFGKGAEKFKFNDKNIEWEDIEDIAKSIEEKYETGEISKVTIVYSMFQSNLQQKTVKRQLLPVIFEEKSEKKSDRDFIYEPEEEVLLNNLLSRYIRTTLYRAVLESQASEHGVRMVSMEMATNNAGEMIRDLTLLANKTRQAAITKEILEIVGGAEAIKG